MMTASPDVITGGVAMNVIADRCVLELDVRYSPKLTQKQARARLDATLKKAKVPYALEPVHLLEALASKPGVGREAHEEAVRAAVRPLRLRDRGGVLHADGRGVPHPRPGAAAGLPRDRTNRSSSARSTRP
jgi:acetylornithine deacetylase/succinyl-diaminopimelate desuccinylase-like protein